MNNKKMEHEKNINFESGPCICCKAAAQNVSRDHLFVRLYGMMFQNVTPLVNNSYLIILQWCLNLATMTTIL